MADVDEFAPIPSVTLPDAPLYLVRDLDRGDAMANWSPDEALPAITDAGRTPLTLTEGLHWLLQRPDVLAPRALLHDDRVASPQARRLAGRQDARGVDQQRHRAATGRPTATRRRSAGAGREIGIPGSDSPRPAADSPYEAMWRWTSCAASTNGSTVSSHATGSDEKTT